jgi:putative Mg2+ transporter-C (MgtC) family protein
MGKGNSSKQQQDIAINNSQSFDTEGDIETQHEYLTKVVAPQLSFKSKRTTRTNDIFSERSIYFTTYTRSKGILYMFAIFYVLSSTVVSIFQPILVDCSQTSVLSEFENPGYAFNQECHHQRHKYLLFLTPEECTFGRRIIFATFFGALIGWERRQEGHPAGIRTMSLTSLGACLFAICGTFAFMDGPMGWDGSRISAQIPSGVGFLGAGIIYKQSIVDSNKQTVYGLTSAASLWLSAAVGIACSGELYFAASFSIAVMMVILRYGPTSLSSLSAGI